MLKSRFINIWLTSDAISHLSLSIWFWNQIDYVNDGQTEQFRFVTTRNFAGRFETSAADVISVQVRYPSEVDLDEIVHLQLDAFQESEAGGVLSDARRASYYQWTYSFSVGRAWRELGKVVAMSAVLPQPLVCDDRCARG